MLDRSSQLAITTPMSPYQGPYCLVPSSSIASSSSCPLFPAVYYCASCSALVTPSPFGSSQARSPTRSPRRLPIPPSYGLPSPSPSPWTSTSSLPSGYASLSSSSSSLSLPSPGLPPCRSQACRPLPKKPKSLPLLELPRDSLQTDENSTPLTSPATSMVSSTFPRRPTDVEEIRRGNLSKLRRHLGNSIPPDLVPPRWDLDEDSASSSSDEEEYSDLPISQITPECVSELTKAISPILGKTGGRRHENIIRRYSRRWLREKKGRRWVEEDYAVILQGLRELR